MRIFVRHKVFKHLSSPASFKLQIEEVDEGEL